MRGCLPIKNNRGMSVALVMGIVVIVGLAIGTVTSMQRNMIHSLQQMNVRSNALQIKQKLIGAIMSPDSWQVTQARNPRAFSAYTSNGQTRSQGGSSDGPLLDLFIPGSSVPFYASSVSTAGFDLAGETCKTFNAIDGNEKCPFRVEVRLKNRYLQDSSWVDVVGFKMLFKPGQENLVFKNSGSDFEFDLVRNLNSQSVQASCEALGGTYNSSSKTCSVSFAQEVRCSASNQSYRGPASGGCATRAITPTRCETGAVIRGFDSRGNPICVKPI